MYKKNKMNTIINSSCIKRTPSAKNSLNYSSIEQALCAVCILSYAIFAHAHMHSEHQHCVHFMNSMHLMSSAGICCLPMELCRLNIPLSASTGSIALYQYSVSTQTVPGPPFHNIQSCSSATHRTCQRGKIWLICSMT